MVHSIKFLTKIASVAHISVKLPNSESVLITHVGQVHLSSDLIPDNVLCPIFLFQSHLYWEINTPSEVLLHIFVSFLFYTGLTPMEDDWIG